MKKKWPEAKTFGALERYVSAAAAESDRQQQVAERRRVDLKRQQAEQAEAERRQAEERASVARWLPVWEGLTPEARTEIQSAVLEKNPFLAHRTFSGSSFATQLYLEELARRHSATPGTDVADSRQTVE